MIRPAAPPVFIKQYGAQRSGTNALRAMLERGLPQAVVLMHVLGDKHQAPTPAVRDPRRAQQTDPYVGVRAATRSAAGATTDVDDAAQAAFLARWSPQIWAAVQAEALRCVVSVKDPYAWIASRLRLQGRLKRGAPGRDRLSSDARQVICDACDQFNRAYGAWLPLAAERPGRWAVVRHLDLVTRPAWVWQQVIADLELAPPRDPPPIIDEVVLPTHWDDRATAAHFERFDRAYYSDRRYLADLGPGACALITARIDWACLAPWGYRPRAAGR